MSSDNLAKLLLEGKSCDSCVYKSRARDICMHTDVDGKLPDENICTRWIEYDKDRYYKIIWEQLTTDDFKERSERLQILQDEWKDMYEGK
jgi:hypothetical protein